MSCCLQVIHHVIDYPLKNTFKNNDCTKIWMETFKTEGVWSISLHQPKYQDPGYKPVHSLTFELFTYVLLVHQFLVVIFYCLPRHPLQCWFQMSRCYMNNNNNIFIDKLTVSYNLDCCVHSNQGLCNYFFSQYIHTHTHRRHVCVQQETKAATTVCQRWSVGLDSVVTSKTG